MKTSKMPSERCGNAMPGKDGKRILFSLKLLLRMTVPKWFG